MADSVDRVFSHALNTVNKIRTGSEKPPAAVRLKLYGLYKQAMEGDVEGIMERPSGNTEEEKRAREKWDAWRAQDGISRTEAKRRYITTLITAMHRYASPSPDARELVSELEFVWDQVKSNVPSSTSSSPYGQKVVPNTPPTTSGKPPMRVLSPPPQADVINIPNAEENDDNDDEDEDDEDDEFVDAQDSQYQPAPRTPGASRRQSAVEQPTTVADRKWRTSVEKALVRMTAEVAALREQLEARRLFRASRRRGFLAWFAWIVRSLIRAAVVDLLLLGAVLLWWKWRGRGSGGKLEKAIWGWLVKVWAKMNRLRLPGMPHTSQG